jgi:stage II sporulation protein D
MIIRVLMPTGNVAIMELEDYLLRVVPAEMPALWPLDALKAQAVAARSWALQKMLHGGRHKVEGADVCTLTHCQAFYDEALYLNIHRNQRAMDNVQRAVTETAGIVLTYGGEVCDACYHNSCGGHTTAAIDVWGKETLYLMSVECPCGQPRKGHGVGMCQYGALALATPDCVRNSSDWQAILSHYYGGAVLMGINEVVR